MRNIFTRFMVVSLLLLVTATVSAQPTSGKVYQIQCAGTTTVALGATALTDVSPVTYVAGSDSKSQLWYCEVSEGNYTFRSLVSGRYLRGNNSTSGDWGLTETSNEFTVTEVNGYHAIRQVGHTNGYAYMHKDGNGNIVSWDTGNANSQWIFIENSSYTINDDFWAAVDALVPSTGTVAEWQENLDAMFTTKSCVSLNSTYIGKTLEEIRNDDNYNGLPSELQKMVEKVYDEQKNNSSTAWDEENEYAELGQWDHDYAKRFRVQMYEPYSIAGEVTSYLRFNAHSNMDNPTGIYANDEQVIYIMVEGEIATGAELWLAHKTGHGATGAYNSAAHTQLTTGLNAVPYFADGSQLWIDYVVHTYNKDGADIDAKFPENRRLSEYKPLKIHIEGGYINGFFNALGDFRASDSNTDNLWGDVDNDDDWLYYRSRVPLNGTNGPNRDFPVLGHRQILLFEYGDIVDDGGNTQKGISYWLDWVQNGTYTYTTTTDGVTTTHTAKTYPEHPNCSSGTYGRFGDFSLYTDMGLDTEKGRINIMMEAWDRIMYSELATMGLVSKSQMEKMNTMYPRWTSDNQPAEIYNYGSATVNGETKTYQDFCQGVDYSEHFNHHGVAQAAYDGYMSGGWAVCNYHYNTMGSIIGKISFEAGPTWGPAHEIGHQHQGTINLNGQTEVTNNLFSNIAVWYMGMGTSRYNGSEGNLEHVLEAYNTEGHDAYTNNIWALTHMYYRLWLYYHLAGKNTQFWPRLYELCRQTPIVNGGTISGETSFLRFYQHACDAAGEDLTEFFRAHGYLEVMDNRLVGDYSNARYTITQEQIDAAIKAVKDKHYPENYAVLLINDGTEETTVMHDGSTPRALWDGSASAEFGSVNDIIDGKTSVTDAYNATVSADGTVTMSDGAGGIGFLVFNEEGELVSFSNKSTFELSEEAAYLLATGKADIVAVDSENNTTVAEVNMTELQKAVLSDLIETVKALPIDDGTYTHIGFYSQACAGELFAALATAKEVLAGESGYGAAYELLYAEYKKFLAKEDYTFVPFDPSLTYVITSYAYPQTMTLNGSNVVRAQTSPADASLTKWKFVATTTDGVYNIQNTGNSYYLPAVDGTGKGDQMIVTATAAAEAIYTVEQVEGKVGAWEICLSPIGEYTNLHAADGADSDGRVVGWSVGATTTASMWYLTAVEDNSSSDAAMTDKLAALISKTEALKKLVGSVELPGSEIALQTSNSDANYYITSNATESGHEPKLLVDNDTETYFHTNWKSEIATAGENHYLQIDFGDAPIEEFNLNYTNLPSTAWNVDAAKTILVQGANTIDNFTTIATLTSTDTNPLPTTKGAAYSSATLGAEGTTYRYLRFTVTSATGGTHHDYYYFGMAELSIIRTANFVQVGDEYEDYVQPATLLDAAAEIATAQAALAAGSGINDAYTALEADYKALETEYLEAIAAKKDELQALIDTTNTLIGETGDIITEEKEEKIALTTTAGSAGYLYCNATIAEGALGNLLKDDDTFIHTQWSGTTADGDNHYLRVDLGEDAKIDRFIFTYTTASRDNADMPATIVVEGANEIDDDNTTKDTDNFTTIATLTHNADVNPLPQATSTRSVYTSDILGTAGTAYRYLRFKVTAITRTVGDVTDDNGYPYFTMSVFGLSKFVNVPVSATVKTAYENTKATGDLILAAYLENADAAQMKEITTSIDLLQSQIYDLQAAYNALKTASETPADADKTELEELIAATEALKSQLYKQAYTQGDALTLQADDEKQAYYLYCNAPEENAPDAVDNVGVSALIDDDETNYLHTEWTGQQSADKLDHYLRVDLGEDGKLSDFVFSYKSARNLPRTFVVEGCNTAGGEYERIGLYVGADTANTLITSGLLGNGNEYRYLRFRVIATHDGGKDNSGYHYFFVLNDFDVYPATITGVSSELKDEYASTIYIYTTSDLVSEVTNGITNAEEVVADDAASQGAVDAEVETLQAVYDKLEEALKYAALPVTITTDEANPVLYNIISKRATDDSKVLQYCEFDSENPNTVSVSAKAANNSYQAWYFMKSENGYLIKPFNGDGKVLAADDTSNGDTKVWAAEEDTKNYDEWTFVSRADGYYNIEVHDRSNYFSNKGGTDYKMGFWSEEPDTDSGSLFKFVEATFENDNARYYQLSDFENTLEYQTATTPEGTTVGAFVKGDAYSTAYTTASDLIGDGNNASAAAADDCYAAYTALRTASADVEQILPEEGKVYRIYITPGLTDSRAGASMRIDDNAKLACGEYAAADAHYYFTFEYDADGYLYMKNLHSATYLDEALTNANNNNVQVGADAEDIDSAKKIAINTLGKSGNAVVVGIVPDGGDMLNCAGKTGNVVAYNNENTNKASAWVIEEVAEDDVVANVKHTVKLGNNTEGDDQRAYSSLCLGYPVTFPDYVDACIVTAEPESNVLNLVSIGGNVIPANTPVILVSEGTTECHLAFTASTNAVATVDEQTNLLRGTTYTTYLSCLNENNENVYNIYLLTKKNGIMAMRWAYENYDAAGTQPDDLATDEPGYVKCLANKAYLKLNDSTASLTTEYFFSFFGTTEVDTVEGEENPLDGTIYDLQGRKIDEVTTAGFYIVNGEKVYVNPEMLK